MPSFSIIEFHFLHHVIAAPHGFLFVNIIISYQLSCFLWKFGSHSWWFAGSFLHFLPYPVWVTLACLPYNSDECYTEVFIGDPCYFLMRKHNNELIQLLLFTHALSDVLQFVCHNVFVNEIYIWLLWNISVSDGPCMSSSVGLTCQLFNMWQMCCSD